MDLKQIRDAFDGIGLRYITADAKTTNRIYLDSAASTLALRPAQEISQQFLKYYSNTHSSVHLTAKISSEVVRWAEERIRKFIGADDNYTTVFLGSGSTLALNRVAEGLNKLRPSKNVILASIMEHHSNDLPHRNHNNVVEYLQVTNENGEYTGIDLLQVKRLLEKHNGKVNYIAITGASNVSGQITPIYELANLAHQYDAYIVVDGAQLVAHAPVSLVQRDPLCSIDFFIFSGHKVYAPGSPGVLVGRNDILNKMIPSFYGGGMVEAVSSYDFKISSNIFDREHAGTLNVPGILSVAIAVDFLDRVGMSNILAKEQSLTKHLLHRLASIPGVKIYPEGIYGKRIGVVSFNIKGIPHELLALILNDYFGIAVRNDCFCAHPFVRECLMSTFWDIEEEEILSYQGMVRASLGLYSTKEDINSIAEAIQKISNDFPYYSAQYLETPEHRFFHKQYKQKGSDYFDIDQIVSKRMNQYISMPSFVP